MCMCVQAALSVASRMVTVTNRFAVPLVIHRLHLEDGYIFDFEPNAELHLLRNGLVSTGI
jgi:hypothetical protein